MTKQETSKIIKEFGPSIGKYFSNTKGERHLFHIVSSAENEKNNFIVKITMINEFGNLMWVGTHDGFLSEYDHKPL